MIETRSSTTSVVGRTVNDLDGAGRVIATRIDLDGDGQFEQLVRRTYDSAGHPLEIHEVDRTLRWVRDREGRVVTRETEARGQVIDRTVVTYDDRGRATRELGDLDDVRYAHDQAGCQIREQHYRPADEAPYIDLEVRCDAKGHRVSRKGQDGSGYIEETWRYDNHGHLIQDELVRDGVLVLDTHVSYDDAGRRVAEDYRDAKGTLTGQRTWSYDSEGNVLSDQIENLVEHSWVRRTYFYDVGRDDC